MKLESIAPRLAKARDQQVTFLKEKYRKCKSLEHEVERCVRLHTHRDLQYYRALATNSKKYIDHREKKLKEAAKRLNTAYKELEQAKAQT